MRAGRWCLLLLAACAAPPPAGPRPGDRLDRQGQEFVVCGQLFFAGTRVVLWNDPAGHDANRSGHYEQRPQKPATIDQLSAGVTQVVLHYDVAGTAQRCFEVLEKRRLSCHFLLDLDGTVYQTLDLKLRAWHAGKANDRSVGIEMANIGAYADTKVLDEWYDRDERGAIIARPVNVAGTARPARPDPVRGKIHGSELVQYDFTDAQYEALGKLLAALSRALPGIKPETPAGRTVLEHPDTPGFLGHYHLTRRKVDPGPAFDWERVMASVRAHLR